MPKKNAILIIIIRRDIFLLYVWFFCEICFYFLHYWTYFNYHGHCWSWEGIPWLLFLLQLLGIMVWCVNFAIIVIIVIRHDVCQKFAVMDFHAKNFTPQKCVICNIVHARYKSVNAFNISNLSLFVRIQLNFTVFEKKNSNLWVNLKLVCYLYQNFFSFWRKLHHYQKFYTAAGSDKYHLWLILFWLFRSWVDISTCECYFFCCGCQTRRSFSSLLRSGRPEDTALRACGVTFVLINIGNSVISVNSISNMAKMSKFSFKLRSGRDENASWGKCYY